MFTDMIFGTDTELTLATEAAYFGIATEKLDPKSIISTIGHKIVDGIATLGAFIKKLLGKIKTLTLNFVFDKLNVEYIEVTNSEHVLIKQIMPIIGTYSAFIFKNYKKSIAVVGTIMSIIAEASKVITRGHKNGETFSANFSDNVERAARLLPDIADMGTELLGNVNILSELIERLKEYKEPSMNDEVTVRIPVKTLQASKLAYKTITTVLEPIDEAVNKVGDGLKKIIDPLNEVPVIGKPIVQGIGQWLNAETTFVNQISRFTKAIAVFNEELLSRTHRRSSDEVADIG